MLVAQTRAGLFDIALSADKVSLYRNELLIMITQLNRVLYSWDHRQFTFHRIRLS